MEKSLKYSQLAKALGMGNASVTMAVKNGKLIPEEGKKEINIEHPVNKMWIQNQIVKGKTFDLNRIYQNKNKKSDPGSSGPIENFEIVVEDDIPVKIMDGEIFGDGSKKTKASQKKGNQSKNQGVTTLDELRKLELKKKKADLKSTEKKIILDELKIQKLKGQLIPYDAVKTVFIYSAETFKNTYQQEVNGLANIFIERLGGEHKHFIELQKELTEKINEIQLMVQEHLIAGLNGIVSEYQEVRERGEKK